MDIQLHWSRETNSSAKKDEKSIAFKYRLGAKSNSINQSMLFKDFPDQINGKWKKKLTKLISTKQFPTDVKATVLIGKMRFELSGRNPVRFANNLANLILMTKHQKIKPTTLENAKENLKWFLK